MSQSENSNSGFTLAECNGQWPLSPALSPRFTFTITLDIVGDKVGERVGVRGSSRALNVHGSRIALRPLTLSLAPKSLPGTTVFKYDDYDWQ
jgi:hypothetical protein